MRESIPDDTEFFFVNGFSDIHSFSEDFDDTERFSDGFDDKESLCLGKDSLCICNACASKSRAKYENESDDSVTYNRLPRLGRSSEYFGIYGLHYYYTLC